MRGIWKFNKTVMDYGLPAMAVFSLYGVVYIAGEVLFNSAIIATHWPLIYGPLAVFVVTLTYRNREHDALRYASLALLAAHLSQLIVQAGFRDYDPSYVYVILDTALAAFVWWLQAHARGRYKTHLILLFWARAGVVVLHIVAAWSAAYLWMYNAMFVLSLGVLAWAALDYEVASEIEKRRRPRSGLKPADQE